MEMFESELIAQIFDHTAAPLTQNAEMYGKLATHYGRYARALSAQLGRSPKALVISNQSALFATGFELASFDVMWEKEMRGPKKGEKSKSPNVSPKKDL